MNKTVFVVACMYCGPDDSDLLVPEVFETREAARKFAIESMMSGAFMAELMDENKNLEDRAIVVVRSRNGNVIDDSMRVLDDATIDDKVPMDVDALTLKDNDYDEYWMWEIHEREINKE